MKRTRLKGKKPARERGPTLFPIDDDNVATEGDAGEHTSLIERWIIPDTWAWSTIGEIGEVRLGMSRSPKNRPGANAVKYLRAANITTGGLDLTHLLEMDFDAEAREVYALQTGDIVLSEASGSPDHVGKPAIWRGELKLCCIQNTVLRVRPLGVSSEFTFVVLQHYFRNGLFASLVRGVGIGHLGADRFSQLPFPMPPRKEQDRIVAEYATQADRANKALVSLRSAEEKMQLQRHAIVRRELGLGDSDSEADAQLPAGWSRVPLADICEVVNGRAFKSSEWREEGLPIIRIQNLRNKDVSFNYFDGELEDKHLVNDGDLLFAWSGDSGTSFGAHIWRGEQGALNQHIYKITPDEGRVDRDFLLHSINAKLKDYAAAAKGGGKRLHLTRGQFVNSEVSLAPLKEQAKIVATIEAHEKILAQQAEVVRQNIARTESLIKSLLSRAVEGNLIKQKEKEGTASSLVAECRENLDKYAEDLAKRRQAARGSNVGKKKTSATQPKKDLVELLKEEGPLLPRDLLRKAGYREENAEDVEEFYRQLHVAHRDKRIAQSAKGARDRAKLKAVV